MHGFIQLSRLIFKTFTTAVGLIFKARKSGFKYHDANLPIRDWAKHCVELIKSDLVVESSIPFEWDSSKRYIIMSNHQSHLDIPVGIAAIPGTIRMLAKKELFNIPFFGRAIERVGTVPIDRNNRAKAMQNLAQAKEHMDQGVILWVYPEGTRSKCGKLGRFKKGGFHLAMNTGALIVPVHIAGTDKALPAKKAGLKLGVSLKVSVGEPIDASQYSVDEKDRLCDDVRDAIKALAKSR